MSALLSALVVATLGFGAGDAIASGASRTPAAIEVSRAVAGPPSDACRSGASLCKEAYDELEKCELANPNEKEACSQERAEADARCRDTTSACHTDGSRLPPDR